MTARLLVDANTSGEQREQPPRRSPGSAATGKVTWPLSTHAVSKDGGRCEQHSEKRHARYSRKSARPVKDRWTTKGAFGEQVQTQEAGVAVFVIRIFLRAQTEV